MNRFLSNSVQLLILSLLGSFAHASLTPMQTWLVPARSEVATRLKFVNGGQRVIQSAARVPSRVYDVNDRSTYFLVTGISNDLNETYLERAAAGEVFYLGVQQELDGSYMMRRYLEGFYVGKGPIAQTYSKTLGRGSDYSVGSYTASMNARQDRIYLTKVNGTQVSVLNLDTHQAEAALSIPDLPTQGLSSAHELNYKGNSVIVAETKDGQSLSTLLFFDPLLKKNVFTLTGLSLGLASGSGYQSVRNTEFSRDGNQAILCGRYKCVVYNLVGQKVTAIWKMVGGPTAVAQFSDDGKFVFVIDYVYPDNSFSVIDSATGAVLLAPFVVRTAAPIKTFQSRTDQSHVVQLRDRILHLSAEDGHIIDQFVLTDNSESFDDMTYLSEVTHVLRMMTAKSTGEITTWNLDL